MVWKPLKFPKIINPFPPKATAASVNGARISQAQARKLKARQIGLDGDLDGVAFLDEPVFATIEHGLVETYTINDDEVLVDSEGHSAAFQLAPSHPDFKGPYHYKKPAVHVKSGGPTVDVDYLPPHAAGLQDDSLVKRSVKLHARRI